VADHPARLIPRGAAADGARAMGRDGASEGERPGWADAVTLAIGVLLLGHAAMWAQKLRRHVRHGLPEPLGQRAKGLIG
jgi:hypothetical protein